VKAAVMAEGGGGPTPWSPPTTKEDMPGTLTEKALGPGEEYSVRGDVGTNGLAIKEWETKGGVEATGKEK